MRFFIYFFLVLSSISSVCAQWEDDFSAGGLPCCTNWVGDTEKFWINPDQQLQLSDTANSGLAYMARSATSIDNATWTFDVFMDFNPSAYNYADVYLVSNKVPNASNVHGYFVRIGYSTDEISLYRQSGDRSTAIEIIDGKDGTTDRENVAARVKVTRSATGAWALMHSQQMDNNFFLEGSVIDSTYRGNQFFSINCCYTITRSTRFSFDNIRLAGTASADIHPPVPDTLIAIGDRILDLHFSEPLHPDVSFRPENFMLDGGIGVPSESYSTNDEHRQIRLVFDKSMLDGTNYTLTCNDVTDPYMNSVKDQKIHFYYSTPYKAGYRDVVINEIMADPYPSVGLPDAEFVELYNTTKEWINLEGWSLEGVSARQFPGYFLGPNGYVLLVKEKRNTGWDEHSIAWGTGGLLNGGELLRLVDPSGQVIDSMTYDLNMYGDIHKKNGGWSLELMDPFHCSSDRTNWSGSTDPSGGTPLKINSLFSVRDDTDPPQIVELRAIDEHTIHLLFNEWISDSGVISFAGENGKITLIPDRTGYGLYCKLEDPLIQDHRYELRLSGIKDCSGNTLELVSYPYHHDGAAPEAYEVISFSDSRLGILFSEKVEIHSAQVTGNFSLEPDNILPSHSSLIVDSIVVLDFEVPLLDNRVYWLRYSGIEDHAGNIVLKDSLLFQPSTNQPPGFNQLVITEIMADPEPAVVLPGYEYIELYNATDHRMTVNDLMLVVGKKSRMIPAIVIDPHQYLMICPASALGLYGLGNKIGLANWPAIINRTDTLSLYAHDGRLVFSIAFEESWYRDMDKKEGGWSLEIIDPHRPCGGMDNWLACRHPSGGTPGARNSVFASKPDLSGPKLLSALATDSMRLLINFNEKLDPVSVTHAKIEILPINDIQSWHLVQPTLHQLYVSLNQPLVPGTKYTVSVTNISDCSGNMIGSDFQTASVFLPEVAESSDIVFSEVLYDPRPGGVEFVELVNRSDKYIDMTEWDFALERDGNYYRREPIFGGHKIIEPGSYMALTTDPYVLKGDYPRGKLENFLHFASLPALSDDGTIIALIDQSGQVIDRFRYEPGYHHPWLDDTEGVSLERIDLNGETNDPDNWTSAARDHAYATPGMPNSQFYLPQPDLIKIEISPRLVIAGEGDARGRAEISYTCGTTGVMANIEIFDMTGRMIKRIAENANLAGAGSFEWGGRDEYGRMVDMGYYVLRVETFGLDGTVGMIKETIAVGRINAY